MSENSISAVSFIFNEASNIDEWLSHLKPYVKELIVFDLESTDDSYYLCQKYTDKVFKRPNLICGDSYKQELQYLAKGDWLLWTYPDERFSKNALESFSKLINQTKWSAFSFMRHEYLDSIRVQIHKDGNIVPFGVTDNPNYQNRLHKNDGNIFYTELVHYELDGKYVNCQLPPELYMEHKKTSKDQEWDNIRLYLIYKYSVWKYRDTTLQPYKRYIDSYRQIIHDSEKYNLEGRRKIHCAEEFWWDWQRYINTNRVTLEEFKDLVGMDYKTFLDKSSFKKVDSIVIPEDVIDEKLRIKNA